MEKVAQPPIRVIDGKEYYVLPVHLNLIDKYGMAEIVQNAQTFGISLVEMTDGEMKLVKDWRKGESNGCPQEGTSEKDQDHGC